MSSTYPLLATLLIITDATREEEERNYHYIMENLDDFVRDGMDLTVWNVNTNVSGLPESRNFLWLRDHYKRPNEPSSEYLRRVFEATYSHTVRCDDVNIFYPFLFYEDSGGHIIAKRRNTLFLGMPPPLTGEYRNNFSLVFALSQPEIKAQTTEMVLFMPVKTDLPEIAREIEVRYHVSEVLYSEFLNKDPQLDGRKRVYGVHIVDFKD